MSEKHLIRVARHLQLGHYLRLGRGEEKSGGRHKTALLVDALEAVLGAMYLDSNQQEVRRVIMRYIVEPELEEMARKGSGLPLTDFKSALQEQLQAVGRRQPSYTLVSERGPEHSKTFTVEAQLQAARTMEKLNLREGRRGKRQEDAEQEVAGQLLEYLHSVASELPKSTASGHPQP